MNNQIQTKAIACFPKTHPPVFLASSMIMAVFVMLVTSYQKAAKVFIDAVQAGIVNHFSWVFTLCTFLFLCLIVWLLFSRFGKIKLGQPDETPEFSGITWFAMMFSAGMGIGLVFWSIAEPISHYTPESGGSVQQMEAARHAMVITYFHWGLHAWAIFMVVGLSLAYFAFRKGLPLSIRSAFYPILGNRIYGWMGDVIDVFAVVGTMFGVATSLGLGSMQVNSGLHFLAGVPQDKVWQVGLIAGITCCATISVVLGLEKGISRLSHFNMIVGTLLVVFVLIAGPTWYVLKFFGVNLLDYAEQVLYLSYWSEWETTQEWKSSWTTFYWGWWIAWAPFVGLFIARVSRGRTIREFILGGLFGPALATFLWLSVFGGTAIHLDYETGGAISTAVSENVSTALFKTLNQLPMEQLTAGLATLVIITFFVTSSDSGSLVIDILTAGGHQDPPTVQRVFWAIMEGVIAATLVVAGGLKALQIAAIASGFPFALLMVAICYALYKDLSSKPQESGSAATVSGKDHVRIDE